MMVASEKSIQLCNATEDEHANSVVVSSCNLLSIVKETLKYGKSTPIKAKKNKKNTKE